MKHLYVNEVVEDKKIHFWQVPKLGAFMAIPVVYKSCLSEKALDAAIADWTEVSKQQAEQDKQREEYEEEQAQVREEKQRNGEPYEGDDKQWPELKAAPYQTTEKKFIICIDTLGQDRGLTEKEKAFSLETAIQFQEAWEKFEQEKLTKDRDSRMTIAATDAAWKEENADKFKEDEEKHIEEKMAAEEENEDEVLKSLTATRFKLAYHANLF